MKERARRKSKIQDAEEQEEGDRRKNKTKMIDKKNKRTKIEERTKGGR